MEEVFYGTYKRQNILRQCSMIEDFTHLVRLTRRYTFDSTTKETAPDVRLKWMMGMISLQWPPVVWKKYSPFHRLLPAGKTGRQSSVSPENQPQAFLLV